MSVKSEIMDSAIRNITSARATLSLWAMSLPNDGIQKPNAEDYQCSMGAARSLMDDAWEDLMEAMDPTCEADVCLLRARKIALMIENALWNIAVSDAPELPSNSDLRCAIAVAMDWLSESKVEASAAKAEAGAEVAP